MADPTYLYSRVSATPCGIALRVPGTFPASSYYKWADGTWTAPFSVADHVQTCTKDSSQPTLWLATVPIGALFPNALLCEYLMSGGSALLDNTQAAGVPLLWPGRGAITAG